MKRYLIFTVTAGNGHNSAAKAVKESLEKQGAEVKVVDLLHEFCDNKTFIWIEEKGYAIAVQHFNNVYNMFFRHYQKASPQKYYKSPVQHGIKNMYDKVLNCIYSYKPDAIFCSHFLPCVMITNLRKLYQIPCPIYSFVFDFVVCPFWEAATGIDKLLIPNESYIPLMVSKGFNREQLLAYGLTTNEKFSKHIDKTSARSKLNLKDDVFTILVMFGGGYWSGNYKIVKSIIQNLKSRNLQIIVVNGKDEKGKKQIEKLKVPKNITLQNYGFSDNVDLFMSAADVVVGKAGGISVTEALNKYLPIVCCKKLPEQERGNAEMLEKEGAGKRYKSNRELTEILTSFLNHPEILLNMRENVVRLRRPNATALLAKDMLASSGDFHVENIDYSLINKEMKLLLKHKGELKD